MSDCDNLQSQLNSISAKLDRLNSDRANCCTEIDKLKGEIIRLNQLVSGANSKAENALSQINPLQTKAAQAYDLGLSNQGEIGAIGAELAALAASAAAAIALARAAMAWIGGIGASLAGLLPFIPAIVAGIGALAAAAATIAALQARLDALEKYLDVVAGTATNAFEQAVSALNLGDLALRTARSAAVAASNAQEFANRAWQRASLALDRAFTAQETADGADKKADYAIGVGNTANTKADGAIAISQAAERKAQAAAATANTAKRTADDAIAISQAADRTAQGAAATANTAKRTADDAIAISQAADRTAQGAAATANTAKRTADDAINIAQPLPPQIEDLRRRLGAIAPTGTGAGTGTGTGTVRGVPVATTPQVQAVQNTVRDTQAKVNAIAPTVAATSGAIRTIQSQISQITIEMERLENGTYIPGRVIGDPLVTQSQNDRKLAEIKREIQNNNNNQNNQNNENKRAIAILTNLQQQCCNKEQKMEFSTITVPQFIKCGENGQPPTISAVTIQVPKGQESATKLQFAQNTQIMVNQCKECDAVVAVPDHWYYRSGGDVPQLVYIYREKLANGGIGSKNYTLTIPYPTDTAIANPPKLPDYQKGNFEGIYRLSNNFPVIINAKDRAEVERVWEFVKPLIKPEYTAKFIKKLAEREGQATFTERDVTVWAVDYFSKGQRDNLPKNKRKKF
jgi:hypothetical protein